jgi:ubiquinone/menaquinone biosynthesis C-methylase UbiE
MRLRLISIGSVIYSSKSIFDHTRQKRVDRFSDASLKITLYLEDGLLLINRRGVDSSPDSHVDQPFFDEAESGRKRHGVAQLDNVQNIFPRIYFKNLSYNQGSTFIKRKFPNFRINIKHHLFYSRKGCGMILSEAETQALIVLIELADPVETANNNFYQFYPKSIEEAATYFRGLRLDWADAFGKLCEEGLVEMRQSAYSLTQAGILTARQVRADRPPIYYWYREFFPAAARSRAYAEFCERLYDKNLCQAGFSDMRQVDEMLGLLNMAPESRVLDLGCGIGMLAEYISDMTGACLYGMDYCPEAIDIANARTALKRDRLSYQVGNLDHLDYQENSFDAIISIDSLYMPNRLDETLQQMVRSLKASGQIAAFYTQMVWGNDSKRETLCPEKTPLGEALSKAGLAYRTCDYSRQTHALMQCKRKIGEEMKGLFEAEGNLALYEFIINESESDPAPYHADTCNFARYLYLVKFP